MIKKIVDIFKPAPKISSHYKDNKEIKNFVIVSNNCWGGEVYKYFNRPFNTPFIGLFIYGPCYIKLLDNFYDNIQETLTFSKQSKYIKKNISYPVGLIKDIEIHFLHYKSEEEAFEKWTKRSKRLLEHKSDDLYFRICDRDMSDKRIIKAFHQNTELKNKISFGIKKYRYPNHIKLQRDEFLRTCISDGVASFQESIEIFDIRHWINTGKVIYK